MDLHITGGEPTDDERNAVDALLGPAASGWQGADRDIARDGRTASGGRTVTGDRDQLLPAFHAVQDRVGWVSRGALNYICRRLSVPPAEAWGVLTFYHLLGTSPRPHTVVHVCDDLACRLRGAEALCRALEQRVGPPLAGGSPAHDHGAADPVDLPERHAAAVGWQRSPCLGQCDEAPAALVTRAGADPSRYVVAPVSGIDAFPLDRVGTEPVLGPRTIGSLGTPRLLARVGRVDPTSLASYRAHGGYRALARALELGPEAVVAEVTASRLLGRGGAAFPTGRKWDTVRRQPVSPHFVVCNADESEPGTFKDRELMVADPFAVIEAMTICGFATGSERGYLYIRGEYPHSEARLANAICQAGEAGLLGRDILGSNHGFDIEIRRGGGAYICGEETALFNSIEGKRGEPRSKPPFPAEVGLFGKPTCANNVETLVNVLDILVEGGAQWAMIGTAQSTGPRLFCLSGHVVRPGLYEVPSGTRLRDVIALAGGVPDRRAIKAVLLGGAAGSFVTPDHLDLPLSFEAAREAGTTLGSGVVMVFDETADIGDALRRMAAFFRHESCGQCVPCRVGTVRQEELLPALLSASSPALESAPSTQSRSVFIELSTAMRDASICGLGQTASSAIESALKLGLIQTPSRP